MRHAPILAGVALVGAVITIAAARPNALLRLRTPGRAAVVDDTAVGLASGHVPRGRSLDREGPADDDGVDLRRPEMPEPIAFERPPARESDRRARAYYFNGPIYEAPAAAADIVGYVRRNRDVAVARWVDGGGCANGSWYEVFDLGYVCTNDGFSVGSPAEPLSEELRITPPKLQAHLPYRYAKVELDTRRWGSIPASGAENATGSVPSGIRFVAIDEVVEDDGRAFVRTLRGLYHRESDLKWITPPTMHGVHLDESDAELPLAFVIDDDVPLLAVAADTREVVGTAERFSRFEVAGRDEVGGEPVVVTPDGVAAPRQSVRIAKRVERPAEIPADAKWIHVDRASQTLVAYEGATPVLATLVSTGKAGYEPPRGVFRVHKRFVSKTMAGDDDVHGTYEVQQVPWTMYYWGSLAIHGAYWHDEFGRVRSHGCTNVPPADARWLFYWAGPDVPRGWHGTIGRLGAWVYTT